MSTHISLHLEINSEASLSDLSDEDIMLIQRDTERVASGALKVLRRIKEVLSMRNGVQYALSVDVDKESIRIDKQE